MKKIAHSLLLFLVLATLSHAATDYDKVVRQGLDNFFQGRATPDGFTVDSPWRATFQPAIIKNRAPLAEVNLSVREVRLPGNPSGLEATYSCTARVTEESMVGNQKLPAGVYTFAGSMNFIETTKGVLIADTTFIVLDAKGKVVSRNFLPWKKPVGR